MQLCNITLRLGGSLLHTVPKTGVTPAEILVLQRLHGNDAVTDIRPVKFDKNRGHLTEYDRLAQLYDGAAQASAPGEESGALLGKLFPGAMKKLPRTLKEIGITGLVANEDVRETIVDQTVTEEQAAASEPEADQEFDPFTPTEDEAA